MSTLTPPKTLRERASKTLPRARPQVTTIRLDPSVQNGLRLLEAHGGAKRPLNKWVNVALAELIERHAATVERELEQALLNIKAYRKSDPGHKRAITAFIDAEIAGMTGDPMEGSREPRPTGPAVSMLRQMIRG
ncbi:MAG: hypothetical protein ACKVQK_04045 [Burkholderiales bacterium]